MSELRLETYSMPGADLGPENPLPPFRPVRDTQLMAEMPGLPPEMRESILWGHPHTILPYTIQDGYNRRRLPRGFRVAVLENEHLRATFLLELGGRLWSLLHKPTGRELLSVTPVFQPANLAIRNAWFSGGVEWNIGAIGHSPFTCAPVFAARVDGPGGTPILRLYEWERIRRVPFQVDAYLPDGSPVLFVRVRITNPHDRAVPMYWWSNIAVPETVDTRVLAPADSAYAHGNAGGVPVTPVPVTDGTDITYASNLQSSASIFFRIPEGVWPWITALDGDGRGLAQASTGRLRGRKMFAWGMGAGGRKWQAFLSDGSSTYIEIQAGLAPTQMQYATMPAAADWSWLEAYGLLDAHADAAAIHGADWVAARGAAEGALQRLIPRAELEAEHARGAAWADLPPAAILQCGSGWGALERRRREMAHEPPPCGPGLVFDDASLGPEQEPWLGLLRDGALPDVTSTAEPHGLVVDPAWRTLLEEALAEGRGENWLAWWRLGVLRQNAGETGAARDAYQRSLAFAETPWSLRNLALLALGDGQLGEAADLYLAALRLHPGLLPLAVECGRALIEAGRAQAWLDLLPTLPPHVRSAGRVRLLEGQAALAVGDLARVEPLFIERVEVDDLREGELSLSELWFRYHELRLGAVEALPVNDSLRARVRSEFPVPEHLDFRMKTA
jgi:tetratricopeptide (TPR) repeat protein